MNELLAEITVVLLSPGVAIDHEIPVRAKKLGKRIIGELELAAELCVAPVIAVTGTNGKTTTCTMIDDILKNGGEKPILCGNVGTPFSSVLDKITDDTLVVLETSSFQLETVSRFAPHVAVITNITPDHLSRHYNMENYIYLKGKILANLRESEYAVLNYDDGIVREFGEKTRAKVVYFSAQNEVNGAYVSDDKIFYKGKYVTDIKSLPVGGEHNVLNLLAAVCVAEIVGMTEEAICSGIKEFKGVKHRIQYIRTVNGADYYNDSKATNADATMKAIDSMNKPTTLILGGKDKRSRFRRALPQNKRISCKSRGFNGRKRAETLRFRKKNRIQKRISRKRLFRRGETRFYRGGKWRSRSFKPRVQQFRLLHGL